MRLTVVLVLLVGGASALGPFGHVVEDTTGVFRNQLESGGPGLIGHIDSGSEGFTDDEPLFLARSATLAAGDIALNDAAGIAPGQPIPTSHALIGMGLAVLSGPIAFMDGNGNGRFDAGDTVVVDADGNNQFSGQDVVLSGASAGMQASSSMPGFNGQLTPTPASFKYLELGGQGFGEGDGVYLDMNDDGHATAGDVRMTSHNDLTFGEALSLNSPDASLWLRKDGAPDQFLFLDEGGNNVFSQGDTAYLSRSGVAAGSIRLIDTEHGDAGTQVRTSDSDGRAPREALAGLLLELGNSDGRITAGEVLALDTDGSGTVSGRDIILSGDQAGMFAQDAGFSGSAANAASGSIGYLDLDGDGLFGIGDIAFYDGDNDGYVSVGDVQLSAPPPGFEPTPTPTATASATQTPTATETATDLPSTTSTQDEAGTETDGPAVPVPLWAPLALLATALLVRRRF